MESKLTLYLFLYIASAEDVRVSYKTNPGVTLIKICDTNLLVATRAQWEKCPLIRPIPKLWAACWRLMEDGKSDQDVIQTFVSLLHRSEREITDRFNKIFESLADEGLLIVSEEK